MIIDTPVHIGVDGADPAPLQPIAVECPVCFAVVRTVRLAAHQQAAHGKAAE